MYRIFWIVDDLRTFFVSCHFQDILFLVKLMCLWLHGHRTSAISQGKKAHNFCSIKIQCWQHLGGQKPTGLAHYMICLCHETGLVGGCLAQYKHTSPPSLNSYITIPYNDYMWLSLYFVSSYWLFARCRISWTKYMSNFRVNIVLYMSPPSNLILLTFSYILT